MSDSAWLTTRRRRDAWLFLTPMLIVLALVAAWPLLRTIYLGFTDANLSELDQAKWVGAQNFLTHERGHWYGVLADPKWWRAVKNTLLFTVVTVSIETVLGLVI